MKKIVVSVVAVILIALIIWLIVPYYKTPNITKQVNATATPQQQQQHQLNATVKKRVEKPYYPRLKFATSLLKQLQQNNPNENIFYSPHSIYQALLLTYFGAAGESEKQLKNLLGLNLTESKSDIQHAYIMEKNLRSNRFQDQLIELNSVDKLYFSTDIRISDSVLQTLNDSIEQLNFADEPDQCVEHINQLVAQVTKNNIKIILTSDHISRATQLIIVNAVYFKGNWEKIFNKNLTELELFYDQTGGKPVYVDMMRQTSYYRYRVMENLKTQILEMPYEGENGTISMFVFLPPSTLTAIDELLEKLTPEILDDALRVHYRMKVEISIPKFSFEKTHKLIPALTRMGAQDLFTNLTDFSESMRMELGDIVHKSKIKIDETGTIAAAATFTIFPKSFFDKTTVFNCNHPFMFIIYDKKFNEILFAGIYRGPNEN